MSVHTKENKLKRKWKKIELRSKLSESQLPNKQLYEFALQLNSDTFNKFWEMFTLSLVTNSRALCVPRTRFP